MGEGSTAAAVSPHETCVGVLACALPTNLPSVPTRLTVYVSPVGTVTRTPNEPTTGTGDGAGDPAVVAVADADGRGLVLGVGDAAVCDPELPQAAASTDTARIHVQRLTTFPFCRLGRRTHRTGTASPSSKPTQLCAPGYVSGTILQPKQAPSPQGTCSKGSPGVRRAHMDRVADGLDAVRFVFWLKVVGGRGQH